MNPTLSHFESLYAASDDPWDVRLSWYEQRKRQLLLACLDRPRYPRVFEPGCGNGEMSAALAERSDALLACDGAASAVDAARRRLAGVRNCTLRVEQRSLPQEWPAGEQFELIVISELAYYFDGADVQAMADAAAACLAEGGVLALCNSRRDFADRATATADVHAAYGAADGMRSLLLHQEDDFLIELLIKGAA